MLRNDCIFWAKSALTDLNRFEPLPAANLIIRHAAKSHLFLFHLFLSLLLLQR